MSKENVALMNLITQWLAEDAEENSTHKDIPRFCLPLKAIDPWNIYSEVEPQEGKAVMVLWKNAKTGNWVHYIYTSFEIAKLNKNEGPYYWVYLPEDYYAGEEKEADSESTGVQGVSYAATGQAA